MTAKESKKCNKMDKQQHTSTWEGLGTPTPSPAGRNPCCFRDENGTNLLENAAMRQRQRPLRALKPYIIGGY